MTDTPRILIVRVGAMGDVIHALPAVAALRQALPDAQIGWAIEPRWAPLLRAAGATERDTERMPLVDAVHLVEAKQWNKRPFSLRTARSLATLRRELRTARYDLAIDLQGTLRSAAIARMSGAARVLGSATPRENVARHLYRQTIQVSATHVSDQASDLLSPVLEAFCAPVEPIVSAGTGELEDPLLDSIRASDEPVISTGAGQLHRPAERRNLPLLPVDAAASAWWKQVHTDVSNHRPSILLAATAGWGAKEWPTENFAELAATLADDGYCVFLNTAPDNIDAVTLQVLQRARQRRPGAAPFIHALPATLPQLIAATREMQAVIAGDTGPLHLAAALGIATIGLFGPTDPARTGPRGLAAINLRDPLSVTDHRRHAQTEPGLARIQVNAVLDALHTVMARKAMR